MEQEQKNLFNIGIKIACLLLVVIVGGMVGCPQYNVYSARKSGEAKLAEAESSRQVATKEAKAKYESSAYLSGADTVRAHGIALSNKIIGHSLKDNPEYLRWLWLDGLQHNTGGVFYIPTESNVPIMEAGRAVTKNVKVEVEEKK